MACCRKDILPVIISGRFYTFAGNLNMFLGYNYIDVLVNVVLALIMLGIGLSLTVRDFKNLFVRPKPLVIALAVQLFLIPLIAFIIAAFSNISPEAKVGMVVVTLCASGASSNLITHLFKGNVALAISMTTINSFITLLSIPLMANLALLLFLGVEREIHLSVVKTVVQIFIVALIPAGIGVFIRRKKENIAIGLEKPLKIILPLLLGFIFTIKIFFGKATGGTGITVSETTTLMPLLMLLNVLAMSTGFFVARLFKLKFQDQFTISIEVGLHNTALALLITGTILNSPEMEKPAVVYAMFSFFTAIIFVLIVKKFFSNKP